MTAYLADIARWQRDLPLTELDKAGFGAVNIKIAHGLQAGSVLYPQQADHIARALEAKANRLRISTFAYIDGYSSGAAQAKLAQAEFSRIQRSLGMASNVGLVHQVDTEVDQRKLAAGEARPPTWAIFRDYVRSWQDYLGRHVVAYTGRWFWTSTQYGFVGRNGAELTPYLWAAPNAGYLPAYPGDVSPHWRASYGGWGNLSVMQYGVSVPFGEGVETTVEVSKSAIRDLRVWQALSGSVWGSPSNPKA